MSRYTGSERNSTHRTLLVFEVADQKYAVAASDVAEILPMAELQRPPAGPQLLAGFLNLAGDLVPVIRLHHLFGLPAVATELWTPLVLIRQSGRRVALLVDRVSRTLTVDEDSILPLPPRHASNECAAGVLRAGDDSITLLAPQQLLLEQEQCAVEELQQAVQRRLNDLKGATE